MVREIYSTELRPLRVFEFSPQERPLFCAPFSGVTLRETAGRRSEGIPGGSPHERGGTAIPYKGRGEGRKIAINHGGGLMRQDLIPGGRRLLMPLGGSRRRVYCLIIGVES